MSWFASSLATSLLSPDSAADSSSTAAVDAEPNEPRGVKEDLSEFSETLTRRFHGLASFLVPPPTHSQTRTLDSDVDAEDDSDSPAVGVGIRGDLAEIGGRLRASISQISGHKAVSEFVNIASALLPAGSDDGDSAEERRGEAVGVTEEVVAFVKDVSMHPEIWLDFPLLPEDEDSDDFDMSGAQQDHVLAVESLAPELADLRIELCPNHMNECCFWKIYFMLLHHLLSKEDAQLLSTRQIVEAREKLHKLQSQTKIETDATMVAVSFSKVGDVVPSNDPDGPARAVSFNEIEYDIPQPVLLVRASKDAIDAAGAASFHKLDDNIPQPVQLVAISNDADEIAVSKTGEARGDIPTADAGTEKYQVQMPEIQIVDKSVVREEPPKQSHMDLSESLRVLIQKSNEDGDELLEEETGTPGITTILIGDDEDVSFSDLEEDDDAK